MIARRAAVMIARRAVTRMRDLGPQAARGPVQLRVEDRERKAQVDHQPHGPHLGAQCGDWDPGQRGDHAQENGERHVRRPR